jgi:hypothetical protein
MKRISNIASLRKQILWPAFTFVILIFAIYGIQQNSANAPQLVIIVATMVVARRFFSRDAYDVLEGDRTLLIKKGRLALQISFDQILRVDVTGGRVAITTSDETLKKFTFLPANTSYFSTGKSRKAGLQIFANEFTARLKT